MSDAILILAIWGLWGGKLALHRDRHPAWIVAYLPIVVLHPDFFWVPLLATLDLACLTIWGHTWVRKPLWVRRHLVNTFPRGKLEHHAPAGFEISHDDKLWYIWLDEPVQWTDFEHLVSALSTYPVTLWALHSRWPLF